MAQTEHTDRANTPMTPHEAGMLFMEASTFADPALAFACGDLLREQAPFQRVEHPEYEPITIVSRHADVYDIEVHNEQFINGTQPVLAKSHRVKARADAGQEQRMLITMDEPEHGPQRNLLAPFFRPSALRPLEPRLAELAAHAVDRMRDLGGECDFAKVVAMPYPLQVILSTVGLPEEDFDDMLRLTQKLFSPDDPELGRGDSPEEIQAVLREFFEYFSAVITDRMAHPTDDLASAIANGEIDGCPITHIDKLGHYVVIATAGHDTTSSAMAGGLQALIEHPDQLALLQERPELMASAVDEIIRWVTPVKHFLRTASVPYDVGGHHFEPGDIVYMSYVAANRDPAVFTDPYRFDITRTPNRHLAFGFGVHYCLGANLARMELRAVFTELLSRLKSIEIAGPVEVVHSTVVSGPKHLPVRYELTH